MSKSLVCDNNLCTFTRIDTNAYAYAPVVKYPEYLTKFYNGSLSKDKLIASATDIPDDTTAPWTNPDYQDYLGASIAVTRDYTGTLINAFNATYSYGGPTGTEWALLAENQTLEDNRCDLVYGDFDSTFAQYSPPSMIGKPGVVHMIAEDVYYNIKFLSWTSNYYDSYDPSGVSDGSSTGGGFSYVRDKDPIKVSAGLPACTRCTGAVATLPVLTGSVDGSFVEVGIAGITPSDAKVTIKAVAQENEPSGSANAKGLGKSTVQLRRTNVKGQLSPMRYTIYFEASSVTNKCSGAVTVCVPVAGYDNCNAPVYGYDATAEDTTN